MFLKLWRSFLENVLIMAQKGNDHSRRYHHNPEVFYFLKKDYFIKFEYIVNILVINWLEYDKLLTSRV